MKNKKILVILLSIIILALPINVNASYKNKSTEGVGELQLKEPITPNYRIVPRNSISNSKELDTYISDTLRKKEQGIYNYSGKRYKGANRSLDDKIQDMLENRDNVNSLVGANGIGNGQAIPGLLELPFADKTNLRVSSHFGNRPELGRVHYGVDITKKPNTNVSIIAAAAGTVVWTNAYPYQVPASSNKVSAHVSAGNAYIIDHGNGVKTHYCHLRDKPIFKVGDKVAAGQYIGFMGTTGRSSGPHLHFGVITYTINADGTKNKGVYVDPLGGWLPSF